MLLSRLAPLTVAFGALTVLSCSDAVPPPAEGGVYFRIYPGANVAPGTACNRTTGHEARIPSGTSPEAQGIGPFTANSPGTPAVDGESGATVSCRVSGSSVSGRINLGNISFGVSGGKVPANENGTANVSSYDPQGLSMQSPPGTPCSVTPLKIQSGAAWATFRCPVYTDLSSPNQSACAAEGVFLLQNCDE